MKRLVLILSVLLSSALASAQAGGGGAETTASASTGTAPAAAASGTASTATAGGAAAALIGQADFSGCKINESAPEGSDGLDRLAWKVRRQLTGRDAFDPPCYMFFRRAVREIGLVSAIFATADRRTRDTRIGTALHHPDPSDPFIHEGPEAYKPSRKQK